MASLVGLQGAHAGQTFTLGEQEITIGRDSANVIAIPSDPAVSRRHARLLFGRSGWVVEDLQSANGTNLNGVRLASPTPLQTGDVIQLGGTSYGFEATAPPRRLEVGSSERVSPVKSTPTGCLLPRIVVPDSAGLLRLMWLLVIGGIIMAALAGVLLLARMGIGALGSIGGHASSPGSNGSANGRGEPSHETNSVGIQVIRATAMRSGRVLVKWENRTGAGVRRVWGHVVVTDAGGAVLGDYRDALIYDGETVSAGATHEDLATSGVGFRGGAWPRDPASASVEATRWE